MMSMWRGIVTILLVVACMPGMGPESVDAAQPIEEAEFAYERGDYTQAARLFTPLAEQGVAGAQFYLGLMHEKGRGVRQDHSVALMWFRKAATQGYAGPQNNLGLLYERGRGVRKDVVRALMWYTLATTMLSGGEQKTATMRREHLMSQLTAAQIEQAQEMARLCQQTRFKDCD
jgi:TPR repeat protein